MNELLLKELEKELIRMKAIKETLGENNLNNEYLEGRIDAIAIIIDLIHQLNQK